MSYVLPSVSVTEILVRASQDLADSTLMPCFVGSINQVVSKSPINLTFPVSNATVIYPNLAIAAIVNNNSVAIEVDNAVVTIKAAATVATLLVAGDNKITGNTGAFAAAAIGDAIQFTTLTHGNYTIQSINGDTATINEVISYPAAVADSFNITRNVGNVICTLGGASYSSSSVTFTSLKYNTFAIASGNAFISYVALRKDLTGFYNVDNLDQLALDMDVTIKNPLGFYLGVVAASASGGNNSLAYILTDELDSTYLASLDYLATRNDTYYLVPLSLSSNVNAAFAAHANLMSQPVPSFFRSAILGGTLTTSKTLASGTFTK